MKTIARLFLLLGCSLGLLHSCNDPMELNNKKALRMLEECPDEYKLTQVVPLTTKYIDFREEDMQAYKTHYESLSDNGFIELEQRGELYHLTFTEAANEFLVASQEAKNYNSNYRRNAMFGSSVKFVITSRRKINEVLEIQERPQVNVAEVTAKLEVTDETPFYFLESKYDLKAKKRFVFRKTTDGWKYCKP